MDGQFGPERNKAYIIVSAGGGYAIHPINTTDAFNARTNTDLLVIAHGAPGRVGGMASAALAQAVYQDHNDAFKSIRFSVCSSANAGGGNPSAASAMAAVYGNQVDKIIASNGACALTGSGSILLDKADYRTSVKHTDQALYDALLNNILRDWQAGLDVQCQGIIGAGNFGQLAGFMQTVYSRYSTADMSPRGNQGNSMNYLLMIKNNADGKPQTECGRSSGTVCP